MAPEAPSSVLRRDDDLTVLFDSLRITSYNVCYTKLLRLGSTKENSTAEIISFGRTVPPLKTKLVNMLILLIIMSYNFV